MVIYTYLSFLDEVHCLENLSPPEESYFVTDLFVIFLVLSLLVAMVVILVLAVNKYSGKTAKFETRGSIGERDLFSDHQLMDPCDPRGGQEPGGQASYSPSCPPAPSPLPPPPPYTPVDNLSPSGHPHPPPSYSLLMPTRST